MIKQWTEFKRILADKMYPADLWTKYSEEAWRQTRLDFSFASLEASHTLQQQYAGWLDVKSATWFIPGFHHVYYGGIHTILRFASYLKTYHGVKSQFALISSFSEERIANMIYEAFPALTGAPVIQITRYHDLLHLQPTDVAIASLWNTAYYLLHFSNTKRKFYFLQDYEALFYPAGTTYAQVEATYRFGFYVLANTPSIKQIYEECYGGVGEFFVPCIDTDVFHLGELQDAGIEQPPYTVFFYGRPAHPRNGFELGGAALKLLKKRFGDSVRIIAAGAQWNPSTFGLKGTVDNLGVLSYEETAKLYRKCDVGLILMFTRHPSYLPMELMASGCLVVTNYNPATIWLLRDGENCLLSETSPTCLADTLEQALLNKNRRHHITQNAARDIRTRYTDWAEQIEKIYGFMCRGSETTPVRLSLQAVKPVTDLSSTAIIDNLEELPREVDSFVSEVEYLFEQGRHVMRGRGLWELFVEAGSYIRWRLRNLRYQSRVWPIIVGTLVGGALFHTMLKHKRSKRAG